MLNCCIERKKKREEDIRRSTSLSCVSDLPGARRDPAIQTSAQLTHNSSRTSFGGPSGYLSDDDEEFFECEEVLSNDESKLLDEKVTDETNETMDTCDENFSHAECSKPGSQSGNPQTMNGGAVCKNEGEVTCSSTDVDSRPLPWEQDTVSMDGSVYQEARCYTPEGRLRPCGDIRLLYVNEPLYIPITQVRNHGISLLYVN